MRDYFSLFGLAPEFDIDLKALESAYFKMQRDFHPDRLAKKSESERTQATLRSMELNDAYHILKAPWPRARHLLAQQGIQVGTEKDTVKPSQELLVESLDMRERLSEAESIEDFRQLMTEAETEKEHALAALSHSFATQAYDDAAQHALRLNYLLKLLDEIRVQAHKRP